MAPAALHWAGLPLRPGFLGPAHSESLSTQQWPGRTCTQDSQPGGGVTVLLSLGAFISAEAMLPHKQAKPAETTLDAQSNPGQISFSKILGLL